MVNSVIGMVMIVIIMVSIIVYDRVLIRSLFEKIRLYYFKVNI